MTNFNFYAKWPLIKQTSRHKFLLEKLIFYHALKKYPAILLTYILSIHYLPNYA